MQITQTVYDFSPAVSWDEASQLIADTLSLETIWKLKERLYKLYEECNDTAIQGTAEDMQAQLLQRASFQGAMALIKELLEDDRNAKGRLAQAPQQF